MLDQFERNIEYVRISLTDRCNLRCRYCMPESGVEKLCHEDILTFDEILQVVRALASLGVRKVRLTGGEPLVRRGITDLVRKIRQVPGIRQIALTTNGVLLPELAEPLVRAGVDEVNISLDTLDPDVFAAITRRPALPQVLSGIDCLRQAGMKEIKLNCVPIRGVNEAGLMDLVRLARDRSLKVRFIELMPIGCARHAGFSGIAMEEVRRRIEREFGPLRPAPLRRTSVCGPAVYYCIPGFAGQVGFIDAIEHKFCSSCNRIRLTAEGYLKLCLNAKDGLDLRRLLRSGIREENLRLAIRQAVGHKPEEHFFQKKDNQAQDHRAMYQVGG